MKITIHITHFFNQEYIHRIKYLRYIVKTYKKISRFADIYIHTNSNIKNYKIKGAKYVVHNLKNTHPWFLSWKCRKLMFKQRKLYDFFIYSEDDILFTKKNFYYWLKYKDLCIKNDYNLGFFRTEKKNNKTYLTDINKKLSYFCNINGSRFLINDINPYCAFWIYDKKEFNNFVKNKYWSLFNWYNEKTPYGAREMSAIGWHGVNMNRYKETVVPILKKSEMKDFSCITHLANNYAQTNNIHGFGSIEVKNLENSPIKLYNNYYFYTKYFLYHFKYYFFYFKIVRKTFRVFRKFFLNYHNNHFLKFNKLFANFYLYYKNFMIKIVCIY